MPGSLGARLRLGLSSRHDARHRARAPGRRARPAAAGRGGRARGRSAYREAAAAGRRVGRRASPPAIRARRPRRGGHAERLRPVPAVPGGQPGRRHRGAGQRQMRARRDRPRRRRRRRRTSCCAAADDLDGADAAGAGPSRPPPGDVAALFYTSGTTGKPKGVELTHRGLLGGLTVRRPAAWRCSSGATRRSSPCRSPTSWGSPCSSAWPAPACPPTCCPTSAPTTCSTPSSSGGPPMFVGVPAMYRMLLEAGAEQRDLSSVRVWASGADVMPADLADRFRALGATVTLPVRRAGRRGHLLRGLRPGRVGGRGGREGCACRSLDRLPARRQRRHAAARLPAEGRRRRRPGRARRAGRRAVGEGPGHHAGLLGRRVGHRGAVLTDDGWLRTGDLARPGPLGTVRFAGRSKHVIKRGGYSVYAVEVEAALEAPPGRGRGRGRRPARRAPRRGARAAAVRLRRGQQADDARRADRLRRRAPRRRTRCPSQVVVVDELPRTGSQKVQKERLGAPVRTVRIG